MLDGHWTNETLMSITTSFKRCLLSPNYFGHNFVHAYLTTNFQTWFEMDVTYRLNFIESFTPNGKKNREIVL